jgi:site-specific DNA-methyltransferase (cytosine-N4-specific)
MRELPDASVQLVVTSPPYFNIKDYSLDGYQESVHSEKAYGQIGDIVEYEDYQKAPYI